MALMIFTVIVIAFGAYLVGNLVGYADAINHQESKKGCQQYSRQPFNERF